MRYGIFGIYSDRLTLEVYDQQEGREFRLYKKCAPMALGAFLSQGELSPAGEQLLLETLTPLVKEASLLLCSKSLAFATAVLRYAANGEAVCHRIEKAFSLPVTVLTGQEQCRFACQSMALGKGGAVGCAIGGESTQIFTCRGGQLLQWASLPLGSLFLQRKFSSALFPTAEDEQQMEQALLAQLESCPSLLQTSCRTLQVTGFGPWQAARLYLALSGNRPPCGPLHWSCDDFSLIFSYLRRRDLAGVDLAQRLFPGFAESLFPSMILMRALGRLAGAEEEVLWEPELGGPFLQQAITARCAGQEATA